jgi:hypothetical protein
MNETERALVTLQDLNKYGEATGFRGLAMGIVLQAITDWRRLVKGAKETGDCNFKELEHFFRYECDRYLTGTSMTGEEILKKLKAEQLKKGA